MIEVYYNRLFHNREIDPDYFLQQLWKIICYETSDHRLTSYRNPESSISPIRMFRAVSLAMDLINSDGERIEKPYICKKDNEIFKTEIDLITHQQDNCSQKIEQASLTPSQLEIAETRFKIIQPLLNLRNRTKKDVLKIAGDRGLSTIYRWIGCYEQNGIIALAPKNYLSGRKRGFPNDIERMISDLVKDGFPKNTTMKIEWRKFQQTCLDIGFRNSEIPAYGTFRRRIKELTLLHK